MPVSVPARNAVSMHTKGPGDTLSSHAPVGKIERQTDPEVVAVLLSVFAPLAPRAFTK